MQGFNVKRTVSHDASFSDQSHVYGPNMYALPEVTLHDLEGLTVYLSLSIHPTVYKNTHFSIFDH